MFLVGDKIVYGENGVCTVKKVAPLDMSGAPQDKLYYHLCPLVGSGTYFTPVDSGAYMRPVMSRQEAEALIDAIPGIEPAVCRQMITASTMWMRFIKSFSSCIAVRRWWP